MQLRVRSWPSFVRRLEKSGTQSCWTSSGLVATCCSSLNPSVSVDGTTATPRILTPALFTTFAWIVAAVGSLARPSVIMTNAF